MKVKLYTYQSAYTLTSDKRVFSLRQNKTKNPKCLISNLLQKKMKYLGVF